MNVFFLAAGLGARLRPLTLKIPKPCVPFLNVPMGYYQFRFLQNLSLIKCVANTHHLPEKVEQLYKNQPFIQNEILISNENSTILGSAGGLKKASKFFDDNETIIMMNADEIFFTPDEQFLQKAVKQHLKNNNLATLVVMQHPEAGHKFGAIWCEQDQVKTIMQAKSKPEQNLEPWHYIGIILLNKKILNSIPESIETNIFYDVLIKELNQNPVEVYKLDCSWYETGNPNDYLSATQNVLRTISPATLDFINRYDPSHLVQNEGGTSLISDLVSVDIKKLRGFNVIAKNTNRNTLDSLQYIENSVLFGDEVLNLSYF